MSRNGQMTSGGPTTAGLVYDLLADAGFDRHVHDEHQLTWAERGVLLVGAGDETWALPQSRALWIPAGVPHSVVAVSRARMLNLWVMPQRCPLTWVVPTLVAADGLTGQLMAHLLAVGRNEIRRERAETLLWDVLDPVPVTPLITTMPTDERARRVAEGLRVDVTDGRTLAQWGRAVGASARTLSRLFAAETGMSFGRWRTRPGWPRPCRYWRAAPASARWLASRAMRRPAPTSRHSTARSARPRLATSVCAEDMLCVDQPARALLNPWFHSLPVGTRSSWEASNVA